MAATALAAAFPRAETPTPELLDLAAASVWLGLSTTKLRHLIAEQELPATVRVGKRNYFRRRDLEAWLVAKGVTHTV